MSHIVIFYEIVDEKKHWEKFFIILNLLMEIFLKKFDINFYYIKFIYGNIFIKNSEKIYYNKFIYGNIFSNYL